MAPPKYFIGLDDAGGVHIQAAFEPRSDLNFKWRVAFLLFRVRESGEIQWGVWDGQDVFLSFSAKEAIRYIDGLIAKGYYFADTILPRAIHLDEGGYVSILPPEHSEEQPLKESDLAILREHKRQLTLIYGGD